MKKKATSKPKLTVKPAYPDITAPAGQQDIVEQLATAAEADGESMSTVVTSLVAELGGTRSFVKTIAASLKAAKDGSVAKQRICEMVFRFVQTAHDEREQRKKSASDLTTEELNGTMHSFLQQHGYLPPDEVRLLRSENERLKAELLKFTTQNAEPPDQQQ